MARHAKRETERLKHEEDISKKEQAEKSKAVYNKWQKEQFKQVRQQRAERRKQEQRDILIQEIAEKDNINRKINSTVNWNDWKQQKYDFENAYRKEG